MQFFPKPKSCRLSKFHSITGDIFINSGNIAGIYVDFFMKNTAELNLRTYGRRFSQLLAPIGDDNIISHVATDGFQVSRSSFRDDNSYYHNIIKWPGHESDHPMNKKNMIFTLHGNTLNPCPW